MKSVLPLIALISLVSTQMQAGFWKHFWRSSRPQYIVTTPVAYQGVPCYTCYTPVYQPVYQPVVYRPVVRKPHFGFHSVVMAQDLASGHKTI